MAEKETKQFQHFLSNHLAVTGKIIGILLFSLVLLAPTPEGMTPAAQRLAAITLLMISLWFTQAIPIAATALIPLVAFPLMGIQSADVVSQVYINKNILLYLGGFIIALGIEKWGLHRRIALHIVRIIGSSLKRIVLGFMVATGFLSMWISNTASTLLMLPIGLAIIVSLEEVLSTQTEQHTGGNNKSAPSQTGLNQFAIVLMLSIAYSASIGGLTTLVGTPTNLQFVGIWENKFPDAPELSTGKWMLAVFPLGFLLLLAAWQVLVFKLPIPEGVSQIGRPFFREQLRLLGKPKQAEWMMLGVFLLTAILWITRQPIEIGAYRLYDGWAKAAGEWLQHLGITATRPDKWVHDSTVAMAMAMLMFFIPARKGEQNKTEYLMDWKTVEKLPWGILLLIGGGFAIAGGFESTRLSEWLGRFFAATTTDWPLWLIIVAICLMMTFLTELTSNIATVAALMPILAGTAVTMGIDPRLLMIPATISASCAFMLPIATPPNAIVFGSNRIPMGSMIRYGVLLNLVGVLLITLATYWLLIPQLDISTQGLPEWAAPAK